MVGRAAFSEETLAELGWLTIVYSGLEDLPVTFIAALLNSGDQGPARDVAVRMGYREKCEALSRLCRHRYPDADPKCLAAMVDALRACEAAGTARNDLVHGIADIGPDGPFVMKPGRQPKQITIAELQAVNGKVFDGFRKTANAFAFLWNTTMGVFEEQ
jgi:hypothetical protein